MTLHQDPPRPPPSGHSIARTLMRLALLAACLPVGGCVAVGATLAGLGFSHQMGGIQYRTFTEPLPKVSRATQLAFKRMAFTLDGIQPTPSGQLIKGTANDRRFEVELDALTESTTRMRAVAKNQIGVIVDGSTAQEIIRQAEKALEVPEAPQRKRAGTGPAPVVYRQ